MDVALGICLGLIALCIILSVALLLQIREIRTEMDRGEQELAAVKLSLSTIQKRAAQISSEQTRRAASQPARTPVLLDEADKKLVRQFIKVLPPAPGTASIHLGDEVSDSASAPVPDALAEQLTKLRGAKFSIDRNGTIVIIGAGDNRAEALVEYR